MRAEVAYPRTEQPEPPERKSATSSNRHGWSSREIRPTTTETILVVIFGAMFSLKFQAPKILAEGSAQIIALKCELYRSLKEPELVTRIVPTTFVNIRVHFFPFQQS